ncbi:MAG: ankyrin repeat domain-containing protein [Gemmataceae bacterium]
MSKDTTELFILLNSNKLDELKNQLTQENINVYGASEQSLLHIAVSRSNVDAVRLLLDLGANPNALDGNRSTPLIYAASGDQYEIAKFYDIIKLLLEAGADPNIRGNKGMTALRWAVTNPKGDFRLVRLLLQHGADPWIENDNGGHAVNYAETVHPDLAEELKQTRPKAK